MHFSYYLRDPKAKITSVHCSIHKDRVRLKKSTGIQVEPRHWNSQKKKIKSGDEQYIFKNRYLNMVESKYTEKLFEYSLNKKVIDRYALQLIWDEVLKPKEKDKNILDVFSDYIDQGIQNKDKTKATLDKVSSIRTKLEEYFKSSSIQNTSIEIIDYDFFISFMNYLIDKHEIQNSTYFKYCDIIGTVLNWGLDNSYHNSIAYKKAISKVKKAFRVESEKREPLTIEEVQKLESLDLSNNPIMDNHRDVFLYKIYLCLRFEDLKEVKKGIIKTVESNGGLIETIEYYSNKEKRNKIMVIGPKCKALMNKRPIQTIKLVSAQIYNKKLKELCRIAGIESPVVQRVYYGKTRKETTTPKWQTISSHISRHTYATIASTSGMSEAEVREMTGHKSSALDRYINPNTLATKVKGAELF
jgi:integrase